MTTSKHIVPATTPAPGWIGGFSTSNPAFAYPDPNLSSLPMLGNMDNIPYLKRQLDVLWPEFYWNTVLGDPTSRCFQMFAPDISRAGYTDTGRIYSIICPQQGSYSPTLGSLNIEVTVTGQRGWVDETADPFTDLLAADLTVVGKVWFAPSTGDKPIYDILKTCLEAAGLPFPLSKEYAIQTTLHAVGNPAEPTIAIRSGLHDGGFTYPAFTLHDRANGGEAWGVANLVVEIGPITSCDNPVVDDFNATVMDIFNIVSGNVLAQGNVLAWNVWFDAPTHVDQAEWKNHADIWRKSIDTGGGYPDGPGSPVPRYADGTPFSAAVAEAEALAEQEWKKISAWLEKHFGISLPADPPSSWIA